MGTRKPVIQLNRMHQLY